MPMTPAQQAVFAADVAADPVLSLLPHTVDSAFEIAAVYNLPAAVDHWVWRTSVQRKEVVAATSQDGTTFTWAGNGFITRSAGEIAAWDQLFNDEEVCNPSLANVRQAFSDIFSGTGNAANNRAHLLVVARRKATRVEKLLAAGTGSTASPATMGYEGPLSYQDVKIAMGW